MKVEIDFDNKVIKVGEKCNFQKLMKFIQTLPDWKEFEIDARTEIVWQPAPYIVERPYREYPWRYDNSITFTTTSGDGLQPISMGNLQLEVK